MAEESNALAGLGGFSQMLTGQSSEGGLDATETATLNDPKIVDPSVVKGDDVVEGEGSEEETGDEGGGEGSSSSVADSNENDSNEGDGDGNPGDSDDTSDLSEFEQDITNYLNDEFSKRLGWELGDEDAPGTIDEFVDFMNEVVKEASAPTFANDEMEKLNSFVEDGGSLKDFYKATSDNKIDVENVDMEDSFVQKQVIKESLKNLGYKDTQINNRIKRSEESGILDDEAQEALDLLKEYNETNKQKLLENQQKLAETQKLEQQKFVSSVQDSIKNINDELGLKLSKEEVKGLESYILVQEKDGMTPFQREMMSDMGKFVTSAYNAKTNNSLLKRKEKQGKTAAVKDLHTKLNANKGNPGRTGAGQTSGEASDGLSILSGMLRNNN